MLLDSWLLLLRTPLAQVAVAHLSRDAEFRPEIPPDAQLPVPPHVDLAPYKALMTSCWAQVRRVRPTPPAPLLPARRHQTTTLLLIRPPPCSSTDHHPVNCSCVLSASPSRECSLCTLCPGCEFHSSLRCLALHSSSYSAFRHGGVVSIRDEYPIMPYSTIPFPPCPPGARRAAPLQNDRGAPLRAHSRAA